MAQQRNSVASNPSTHPLGDTSRNFNWISSFPGPDELDAFIKNTVNNGSIARTCLKEAKDTKEKLKDAMKEGEMYVKQSDLRINERNRAIEKYSNAVQQLRTKAGR